MGRSGTTVGGCCARRRPPPDSWPWSAASRSGPARRWTYAELLAEAERAARALTARFEPGERLAVWAPNCRNGLLEFGAALAGVILVTVNPALRPAELDYVLNQSGACGIFLVPEFRAARWPQFLAEVRRRRCPRCGRWSTSPTGRSSWAPAPAAAALPEVSPDDVAQIQYTSGTTGFPKGAELHHRGLTNNARFWAGADGTAAGRGVREPDAAVPHGRLRHGGAGRGTEPGGTRPGAGLRPGPGAGADRSRAGGVLRRRADDDDRACWIIPTSTRRDLSSLRAAVSGGSPVPAELVRQIEDRARRPLHASCSARPSAPR